MLERRVGLTAEQAAVKAQSDGQVFGSISADGTRLLMSVTEPGLQAPVFEWDLMTEPPTLIGERFRGFAFAQGESNQVFSLDGVAILDGNFEQIGVTVAPDFERGVPLVWRSSADGSRHAGLREGAGAIDVYDTQTGERISELTAPGGFGDDVFIGDAYSFSDDGNYLAASFFTPDGPLWFVFDTSTGEVTHTGEGDSMRQPWLAGNTGYSNPPDRSSGPRSSATRSS